MECNKEDYKMFPVGLEKGDRPALFGYTFLTDYKDRRYEKEYGV
jgi:hypothetical protein